METRRPPSSISRWLLVLACLVAGVIIGSLLDPIDWFERVSQAPRRLVEGPARIDDRFKGPRNSEVIPDNGLPTLRIAIDDDDAAVLTGVRDRAMEKGVIEQEPSDTVRADVSWDAGSSRADVRIKGDWVDHVSTDQWSLRIKLKDDKFQGMRVFSIQRPGTRGWMWEWFMLAMARRAGILAPRGGFVNVELNDRFDGIYYLEEHFSKELLESQGRREGPIVLLDESSLWSAMLQSHHMASRGVYMQAPRGSGPAFSPERAEARAYGGKRLSEIDGLARSLDTALGQLTDLQRLIVANQHSWDNLGRLRALHELQGRTIDSIFDPDALGRAYALASVFQIKHSLIWHNMRFYHDPVRDRLEPILFDNMPDEPDLTRTPAIHSSRKVMKEFARSDRYTLAFYRSLAEFCDPGFLEDVMNEIGAEARQAEAALVAQYDMDEKYRLAAILQRLRGQQAHLRSLLQPADPIGLASSYSLATGEGSRISATITVDAWSTTLVPTILEGFRFSNGTTLDARSCLVADVTPAEIVEGGGVLLPGSGAQIRFRFSMDDRLANLSNVTEVKRLARDLDRDSSKALDLALEVMYRPAAGGPTLAESLVLRRLDDHWRGQEGRPPSPSLIEALAEHPCLEWRAHPGQLWLRPGRWNLDGDLVVPAGYPLHAAAATTVRFPAGCALITDAALIFKGRAEKPVRFEPREGHDSFAGILVVDAADASTWQHVEVARTDVLDRAGWRTTGGVTFYHSPVTMADCRFLDAVGEDGLNIFGCPMTLERVVFERCGSDSFDGDFITGDIRECRFLGGLADGLDLSGSKVSIIDCVFDQLGDKAISVGEQSQAGIRGGRVTGGNLGIVAKDLSEVRINGTRFSGVGHYILAAYIKKLEFGPATIHADSLVFDGDLRAASIAQTGSAVILDGQPIPTSELDVQRLYREGVLGN